MSKTNYDVLIIGSGAGGGATLYRLCELWKNHGAKKIGILEKGDKLFHSHALNIPTMNVSRMRSQLWPDNSTDVGERLPEFPGVRLTFALGGRTLFWNAVTPRPPYYEIKKWPVNFHEMDVYFRLAEKIMAVTTAYANGSSMQKVLLNRLLANGIPEAADLPLAIDMSGSHIGQIHSNPWFSSINFLAYAINNKPFDLALNAYTPQVLIGNGKVVGVKAFSLDNFGNPTYFAQLRNPRIGDWTLFDQSFVFTRQWTN
jgi:gluconate 5-dehydrogenase